MKRPLGFELDFRWATGDGERDRGLLSSLTLLFFGGGPGEEEDGALDDDAEEELFLELTTAG